MSMPFSLLCLILLPNFHKNASFRPNLLDYLNATLVFGKQTKDNFINRKFQIETFNVGPHTHSFTHFCARFSFGGVARAATLGGPNMPHDQQQSQFPWVHTKIGSSKVGDVVTPPAPWTTSERIFRGCGLLPPLRWCCVECVIHHERDVREEQHHSYMWCEQAIKE